MKNLTLIIGLLLLSSVIFAQKKSKDNLIMQQESRQVAINKLEEQKKDSLLIVKRKQLKKIKNYKDAMFLRLDAQDNKVLDDYKELHNYEYEKYYSLEDYHEKELELVDEYFRNKQQVIKNELKVIDRKIELLIENN